MERSRGVRFDPPHHMRLYRATGKVITLLLKAFRIELRVSGIDRLPDVPVLFVVNHFTRFETFLLPYAIYHRLGRTVHSLATHSLFTGLLGRYLTAIGVMSVRDPLRNRRIIGELMTGRCDWVIYPEGGLVKSKRTTLRRRGSGKGQAPRRPRTGAAMMALKAEIGRRRYIDACRSGDRARMHYYETRYDFSGPEGVAARSPVVVPVTITYPRLRAGRNALNRLLKLVSRQVDPRTDEELQVEGTLLLAEAKMNFHFGDPLPVSDYLDRGTEAARRVASLFGEQRRNDLLLRRQARRLTATMMRSIYDGTEITFDHLFCYGLRATRDDVIPVRRFHESLYLAAMQLRGDDRVRLHAVLSNGIAALTTGAPFEPLESIERLAIAEGVLHRENGTYVINRAALLQHHDRNEVRLRKMVQVIANEVEAMDRVAPTVRSAVNLSDTALGARLPRAILESDRAIFRREYARWREPGVSRPPAFGEPFFLEAPKARAGVVLVHGYLSCPEQMRPLAEHLHGRGHSVYVVRLDGHGTAPAHLNEVTWQRWLGPVAQAHTALRHSCERTFIVGFSLGGLLGLLLAADLGAGVDGLVSISAPLRLRNRLATLVPAVVGANRMLRRVQPGREHPSRANCSESPDLNYPVDYLHGLRELRRAMAACRRSLPRVTAPALVVHADRDPVSHPGSAGRLLSGLSSRVKEGATIESSRHVIVRGEHSAALFEVVARFIDERLGATAPPVRQRGRDRNRSDADRGG